MLNRTTANHHRVLSICTACRLLGAAPGTAIYPTLSRKQRRGFSCAGARELFYWRDIRAANRRGPVTSPPVLACNREDARDACLHSA